jgi:Skp family chaperone for outer membrane proteins
MGMAEKVPGWFERVLLPQISELKGELKAMDAKMDAEFRIVHSELGSLDQKLSQRIESLDQKLSQRIDGTNRRLDESDKKLDMVQRVAVLEAKVQELQSKK